MSLSTEVSAYLQQSRRTFHAFLTNITACFFHCFSCSVILLFPANTLLSARGPLATADRFTVPIVLPFPEY